MTKAELEDFKTGKEVPNCILEARPLCEDFPQLLHQIIYSMELNHHIMSLFCPTCLQVLKVTLGYYKFCVVVTIGMRLCNWNCTQMIPVMLCSSHKLLTLGDIHLSGSLQMVWLTPQLHSISKALRLWDNISRQNLVSCHCCTN